jgi:hypothetical protein
MFCGLTDVPPRSKLLLCSLKRAQSAQAYLEVTALDEGGRSSIVPISAPKSLGIQASRGRAAKTLLKQLH